jgi:hypothetical protein
MKPIFHHSMLMFRALGCLAGIDGLTLDRASHRHGKRMDETSSHGTHGYGQRPLKANRCDVDETESHVIAREHAH